MLSSTTVMKDAWATTARSRRALASASGPRPTEARSNGFSVQRVAEVRNPRKASHPGGRSMPRDGPSRAWRCCTARRADGCARHAARATPPPGASPPARPARAPCQPGVVDSPARRSAPPSFHCACRSGQGASPDDDRPRRHLAQEAAVAQRVRARAAGNHDRVKALGRQVLDVLERPLHPTATQRRKVVREHENTVPSHPEFDQRYRPSALDGGWGLRFATLASPDLPLIKPPATWPSVIVDVRVQADPQPYATSGPAPAPPAPHPGARRSAATPRRCAISCSAAPRGSCAAPRQPTMRLPAGFPHF